MEIITHVLGKDVASIIYQLVWRMRMKDVNAQYLGCLVIDLDARTPRISFGPGAWFNYRSPVNGWGANIDSFRYDGTRFSCLNRKCLIPKAYWR